jgi:FtsP/CotA-like multicopper oxidase with cupredoxin domain
MTQFKPSRVALGVALALASGAVATSAVSAPLPGGSNNPAHVALDPLTVQKYLTPLVIPPEMPPSPAGSALNANAVANYNISVRQKEQQVLPATQPLNGLIFGTTTVWGYGNEDDLVRGFHNWPSFTIETTSGLPVNVRWMNRLTSNGTATGTPLPHITPVDQTLHWAKPQANIPCVSVPKQTKDRDCAPATPSLTPYTGPVPMVVHVHGAEVGPEADGYAEAWWMPFTHPANPDDAATGFFAGGTHYAQSNAANAVLGSAFFSYPNAQPAATIWYHDHALGMTRNNVYAGPAGFWLIRGGANDLASGLPFPRPAVVGTTDPTGKTVDVIPQAGRLAVREVPIAIQDRSFSVNPTTRETDLFYPASRVFFDGYAGPYSGSAPISSDIAPIWNPEAFFNTMTVNGNPWPVMQVAPALYRFRILNGSNSRFLNLSLKQVVSEKIIVDKKTRRISQSNTKYRVELPFYQIGADQGFLPKVVQISTGFKTVLPGNGTVPAATPAASPQEALLVGLAERADVIVDFRNLPNGTRIRMLNTGPDAPFGGFPAVPIADPATTGQVMEFVVNTTMLGKSKSDPGVQAALGEHSGTGGAGAEDALVPQSLVLPAEAALGAATAPARQVSLNEEESQQVCVKVNPAGRITVVLTLGAPVPNILQVCAAVGAVPMAPKAAVLGTFSTAGGAGVTTFKLWDDPITEIPALGATEEWEMFNTTVDAHPMHLHLVRFQVVNRQRLDPLTLLPVGAVLPPQAAETGYKDTVIAYPGQVTRVKATFGTPGLYMWHCHIVEHEDNEMMRPFCVGATAGGTCTSGAGKLVPVQ